MHSFHVQAARSQHNLQSSTRLSSTQIISSIHNFCNISVFNVAHTQQSLHRRETFSNTTQPLHSSRRYQHSVSNAVFMQLPRLLQRWSRGSLQLPKGWSSTHDGLQELHAALQVLSFHTCFNAQLINLSITLKRSSSLDEETEARFILKEC